MDYNHQLKTPSYLRTLGKIIMSEFNKVVIEKKNIFNESELNSEVAGLYQRCSI